MTSALSAPAPAPAAAPTPAPDGLPLTLGLAGREVLLVGAGPVSARRAETFLESGAVVRVVAPRVSPELAGVAERAGGAVVLERRPFAVSDLDTPWVVHVATGDPTVDAEVSDLCEQRRLWCVSAGDARLGSARVPARTAVPTPSGPVRIAVDSGDPRRSVRMGRQVARSLATAPAGLRARRRTATGWAALVGGCGDGDLLTVRARRLVHAADVLVVDGDVDPGLVAELDDDVEVIAVAPGRPSASVSDLVASRVATGHGVVCIVEATALARGSRALAAQGIHCDVVPGVVRGGYLLEADPDDRLADRAAGISS